jgi:hypothetical protein
MSTHQSTAIEPGKWYISELPAVIRLGPGDKTEITYEGARNTRLDGPFSNEADTRQALKGFLQQHPEYAGLTYPWQCGEY